MNGPKREGNYPDRGLDCQEDVAGKLVEALDEAEAAGWDRIEAAKALAKVANGIHMGERGTDPDE
ncbi:hypothetical protein DEA98_14425 [Brucella pseudogrignonensis]|uniref:Uncharacterized protein n=1 Tax=Brucella pseudogrignonensis TaxID=419475 RepID=A0A7Y3T3W6_9HYPH|nr:hypothetical protein [Brucella pseudogrignonensis]MCM0752058.1 hypothetical protein [Brucella pseudogrignonensis]NNV20514.1 hypothetical protein [Brucella pseudogrignonensis]